jgi:hypothetical protein
MANGRYDYKVFAKALRRNFAFFSYCGRCEERPVYPFTCKWVCGPTCSVPPTYQAWSARASSQFAVGEDLPMVSLEKAIWIQAPRDG